MTSFVHFAGALLLLLLLQGVQQAVRQLTDAMAKTSTLARCVEDARPCDNNNDDHAAAAAAVGQVA